ncbi:MAG: cytochrome c [Flavobacteriales bacterium]|nr:cytochrome c [Flavobacteriales bacterium]
MNAPFRDAHVGFGAIHRRVIFFGLVALFVLQTGMTWTLSTDVDDPDAHFSTAAYRGRALYQAFNCTACHQLYGLGGYMGPDLTNVTSDPDKGRAFAKGLILHGTTRMPALGLTDTQADDIVAYLEAVAATGTYPVRSLDLTPWGTYTQMTHAQE